MGIRLADGQRQPPAPAPVKRAPQRSTGRQPSACVRYHRTRSESSADEVTSRFMASPPRHSSGRRSASAKRRVQAMISAHSCR